MMPVYGVTTTSDGEVWATGARYGRTEFVDTVAKHLMENNGKTDVWAVGYRDGEGIGGVKQFTDPRFDTIGLGVMHPTGHHADSP